MALVLRFLGAQWLAIGFVTLVSLAINILVARTLSPDLFGVYSVALSGGAIVAIVLDGGFGRLVQREHAHPTAALTTFLPMLPQAALAHVLVSATALSLLATAIFPQQALTVVVAIWFYAAAVLNQFGLSTLRGEGRMVKDASWQVGNRTFTAVCVGVAILLGAGQPWQIFLAQFVGSAAFAFVIMRFLRVRPLWKISPAVYASTLPFVWLDLATVIYFRSDMLLLEWFDVSKFEVGKYGVAYRLIEAVILFASPVGLMLFRKFRLGSGSPRRMLREMLPALVGAHLIGVALMVGIIFFSEPLIDLVYGAAYFGAHDLLAVLGIALIFILPNGVLNQAALALGLERWFAVSATITAVVNVVGNMLLIPLYGTLGSAWMTVATEAVLGCMVGAGVWYRCHSSMGKGETA
jgi:O-antigen/teichoic acid export membrane protein